VTRRVDSPVTLDHAAAVRLLDLLRDASRESYSHAKRTRDQTIAAHCRERAHACDDLAEQIARQAWQWVNP